MASKVTETVKLEFQRRLKDYKSAMLNIENKIKDTEKVLKLTHDEGEIAVAKVKIADFCIGLASYGCGMSTLSLSMMKHKNENYLNDARKALYKSILMLEEAFGKHVDEPLNENDEVHEKIGDRLDDVWKYRFAQKLGYMIEYIKDCYGENTKWKWSFVDMEGRYSVSLKNMLHYKGLIKGLDPRAEGYRERTYLLKLVKKQLADSATAYRNKYEMIDQRIDDMKHALELVGVARKIHMYLGEENDASERKKVYDLWQKKLEADLKTKEKGR